MGVMKEMVTQVSADLVVQKETVMKETMRKAQELVKQSQLAIMEEVKGASMREMMEHIEEHRIKVRQELQKTVTVLQEGIQKDAEEQKRSSEKMSSRVDLLVGRLAKRDKAAGKAKEQLQQLEDSVAEVKETVKQGEKQRAKHSKDAAKLKNQIEKMLGQIDATKDKMADADSISELQSFILKVSSKVNTASEQIDQEVADRQKSLEGIAERVTANEEHVEQITDDLDMTDEDIGSLAE